MNTAFGCNCTGYKPTSCHICIGGEWVYKCAGCQTCSDGECEDSDNACPIGQQCSGGQCVDCKEWTAGFEIMGIYQATDASICDCTSQISTFTDSDYWEDASGYERPDDAIEYSWNATGGTWDVDDESTFEWTAPATPGQQFTITVTVDDVPNEMTDACPGSTRDDNPVSISDTLTVNLPAGCMTTTIGPPENVRWIKPPDENYEDTECENFGSFKYYPFVPDIEFRYSNGTWVCEIHNVEVKTRILVRAADSYPNKIAITSEDDVSCGTDADTAIYDLTDNDLDDDEGAPLLMYWVYSAIVDHEEKHRSDWQGVYGPLLEAALASARAETVTIDCSDPTTHTCNTAKTLKQATISTYFSDAYENAQDLFDDPDTELEEHEQRAYEVENAIEQPIADAIEDKCD